MAHWTGAVIANNKLELASARALLEGRDADAVSFGRPYISNPDLVERFRRGAPLAPPDRTKFYTGEAAGYIDYPALDTRG